MADAPALPLCAICGRRCIPLADYTSPTCIRCDETMRVVLDRAGMLEPPAAPLAPVVNLDTVWRHHRNRKPCGTHAAYTRHIRHKEPIDPACSEGERLYRAERRQAIAAHRLADGGCTIRIGDPR